MSGCQTEQCLEVLSDLLETDPENKAARQYYNVKQREWQLQKQKDSQKMRKMFASYDKAQKQDSAQKRLDELELLRAMGFRLDDTFWRLFGCGDAGKLPLDGGSGTEDYVELAAFSGLGADEKNLQDSSDQRRASTAGQNGGDAEHDALQPAEQSKAVSSTNEARQADEEEKTRPTPSPTTGQTRSFQPVPWEMARALHLVKRRDHKMWAEQARDSIIFTLLKYALDSGKALWSLDTDKEVTLWFFGAAGNFELAFLELDSFLAAFPEFIENIRLVCVGFLGEVDVKDVVTPDAQKPNLQKGVLKKAVDALGRTASLEVYCGLAEDWMKYWQTGVDPAADPGAEENNKAEHTVDPGADDTVVNNNKQGFRAYSTKINPLVSTEESEQESSLPPAAGALLHQTTDVVDNYQTPVSSPTSPTNPPTTKPTTTQDPTGGDSTTSSAGGTTPPAAPPSSPTFVFLLHPYFHRYFSKWWAPLHTLISTTLPFAVLGGSDPDYSFAQDQTILEKLGAKIVTSTTLNPYPLTINNTVVAPGTKQERKQDVSKCHHIIICAGGSAARKGAEGGGIMKTKIELMAADVHLVGK